MYDDFINSLSDTQLEKAYAMLHGQEYAQDDSSLRAATYWAYHEREQKTVKFAVKQSLIENFKNLLIAEEKDIAFLPAALSALREKRILNGWSYELEAALKAILYEVLEQL